MWPEKRDAYFKFGKHKKNGTTKRKQSKGCFGSKRNDDKLIRKENDKQEDFNQNTNRSF